MIKIPDYLSFTMLHIAADAHDPGGYSYDQPVLAAFAVYNGVSPDEISASEDMACVLIAAWYVEHLRRGGTADLEYESLQAAMRKSIEIENADAAQYTLYWVVEEGGILLAITPDPLAPLVIVTDVAAPDNFAGRPLSDAEINELLNIAGAAISDWIQTSRAPKFARQLALEVFHAKK